VTLLVAGAQLKVVAEDGSILRELTLDATRRYRQFLASVGLLLSIDGDLSCQQTSSVLETISRRPFVVLQPNLHIRVVLAQGIEP
jgi:hypothetical protein